MGAVLGGTIDQVEVSVVLRYHLPNIEDEKGVVVTSVELVSCWGLILGRTRIFNRQLWREKWSVRTDHRWQSNHQGWVLYCT